MTLFDAPTPDLSPGRTRRNDYQTSRAGAGSVAFRAGSQKARLVSAYVNAGRDGLTDDAAAVIAGIFDHACYWKRCNELRAAGVITPTGETRVGQAGIPRMVCRATWWGWRREDG